jgi:hypothetical protein
MNKIALAVPTVKAIAEGMLEGMGATGSKVGATDLGCRGMCDFH